jgi:hypothetical protein
MNGGMNEIEIEIDNERVCMWEGIDFWLEEVREDTRGDCSYNDSNPNFEPKTVTLFRCLRRQKRSQLIRNETLWPCKGQNFQMVFNYSFEESNLYTINNKQFNIYLIKNERMR